MDVDKVAGGVVVPPPGAVYPFVVRDPQPESATVRKLRKPRERANFAGPSIRISSPKLILKARE
jgi:hypothetical protein